MNKIVILLLLIIAAVLPTQAQKYQVNGKDGKIRVVEYVLNEGEWECKQQGKDIYIENGFEFEAVPPVSKDKIVMEYEGSYYHVVFPDKELKLIDAQGQENVLGFCNKLRNSWLGAIFLTEIPAEICFLFGVIALLLMIISLKFEKTPKWMRIAFASCLSFISVFEIAAFFSVGSDAYWWCNPDDVGYLKAIGTTLLFSIVAVIQIYGIKLYKFIGTVDGPAHGLFMAFCGIGAVAAVLASIGVLMNFLFAVCCLIFGIWLFSTAGKGRNKRTDQNGNTYYVDDFGVKRD